MSTGRAILALGLAYAGRAGSILAPASLWMGSSAEAETNFPQPDLKAATYNTVLHSSPRASINSIPLLWAGERGTWRVWNPSSCPARILPVVFFHVFDLHSRDTPTCLGGPFIAPRTHYSLKMGNESGLVQASVPFIFRRDIPMSLDYLPTGQFRPPGTHALPVVTW
ncbi:hypothetical protein K456DRAFT_485108 [Colletotrichum gloeosporioides 23]|nr:hypothetical protein K456DRAFT_485108 [Colletotrichum gloeosporioides 23]